MKSSIVSLFQGRYTCIPIETYVLCNIGNPLPQGYSAEFTLRLNPVRVDASHRMLEFRLHANTYVYVFYMIMISYTFVIMPG